MSEVWRKIPGYPNYEASSLGRIRSYCYGDKPKIMKQHSGKNGYKSLKLRKNKTPKAFLVHRLVAAAFGVLKGLDDKLYINHLDGDKHNNCLENLERVTRSQNEKHAFKIGLKSHKGENHNQSKLTKEQVVIIRKRLKKGETAQKVASSFNVTRSCVYSIKQYRSWKDIYV
jgi:hypothetical protein